MNQNNRYKALYHSLLVFLGFSVFYVAFFAPIVLTNRLLADTDALFYYLPGLYAPRTLWTPLLFSGFPAAADPQIQTWYPLAQLFSLLPHTGQTWNNYLLIAYILASCFVYGYVYHLTRSKLAAIVSGVSYGLSGFMISHMYHVTMIHAAAWMPLMLWALERLRDQFERRWFAIGTIAVACCFLSGHPQISVYGISVAIAYSVVLGWTASQGRWDYYRLAATMFGLGILLTSIQLIPTAEFSALSLRAEMTFESFVTYSLPAWQAFTLIFPYLTNGNAATSDLPEAFLYGNVFWGNGGWAEVTGYMGILPLLLAVIAFWVDTRRRLIWFWIGVGGFALLLALGDSTPLAWVVYQFVPAYNKFRAQGRNFVEVHLAVSVLAGLGVAAVQQTHVPRRLILRIVAVASSLMLLTIAGLQLFSEQLKEKARVVEIELSLVPWENPAIALPLLAYLISSVAFLYWSSARHSKQNWIATSSQMVLLVALLIDLGSFAQFGYWRYLTADPSILKVTASAQQYRAQTRSAQQRLLTTLEYQRDPREFAPNLSRLWKLPNAGGYSPLTLSRVGQFVPMSMLAAMPTGSDNLDRSLDLMAVRYLLMPQPSRIPLRGVAWSDIDLSLVVGSDRCAPDVNQSATLNLPKLSEQPNHRDTITAIGFVTSLACSPTIPDLTEVATVSITDIEGRRETLTLKAGLDTAEWAADCVEINHQKATVFSSTTVSQGASTCQSHRYVTILPLKTQMKALKTLSLKWNSAPGQIVVNKISLIDQAANRSFPVLNPSRALETTPKWRSIDTIGNVSVYENQQAMPRAWLVPTVMSMSPEAVLQTIKTGKLTADRPYDPSQVALVEEDFTLNAPPLRKAVATVSRIADTQLTVNTETSAPAFLVLSDVYYPGWQVSIDGKLKHLFQTDYVLRGVRIPAGKHMVQFNFVPRSFHLGVGMSVAGLVGLGYILFRKPPRRSAL